MRKISTIVTIGLAIILGTQLIGCEKKQEVEPVAEQVVEKKQPVPEPTKEKLHMRIVTPFGSDDERAITYQAMLDEFRTAHPNVIINDYSAMPDEVWEATIVSDFIANNEPDIIFTFTGGKADNMIHQNKFVSLEEIQKEYPQYATNIYKGALEHVRAIDGNIYAVPIYGFYQGLFVNKDIFEEYNLDLPTNWNSLMSAIQVLNENEILPIAAALGDEPAPWIEHLILSQGGTELYNNSDIIAMRNKWEIALSYLSVLYDMGAFSSDVYTISSERAKDLFINKKAAMILENNDCIDEFSNVEEVVMLPFPQVPGGKKNPNDIVGSFPFGWYITRQAWDGVEKRELLIEFIETMISKDTIQKFVGQENLPAADIGIPLHLPLGFDIQSETNLMSTPLHQRLPKAEWNQFVDKINTLIIDK